jgi:endonuclease/exonuclease/phosphatase family metal-dependent hydrolase
VSDGRLRILTANLLGGRADAEALAELIERLRVDVAAVQELGEESARAIAEILPYGKLEPDAEDTGLGIAMRRPGEVRRLPLPHRDAHVAELAPGDWPGLPGPLEIVNVHLQAPHATWPWVTLAHRRGQVTALTGYLSAAERARRVVVGDLNATPLWPAYRELARHVPDAIAAHARRRGARAARTWGPWPGAPRLLRIDHVLARGIAVLHAETVELPGSDHHGVLVEVGGE